MLQPLARFKKDRAADTLQNPRAFMEVAQRGSFAAAGRKLGIATSVVAKRVGQLEARTGTQLFHRSTREATPTEAGQSWLGRVRSMLADMEGLLDSARSVGRELEGPLRIKAPTTLSILYLGGRLHPSSACIQRLSWISC